MAKGQRLENCGMCVDLVKTEVFRAVFYGCGRTGLVVPQTSGSDEGAVFHRVPMSCPRPDSEVIKRNAKR